MTRKLLVLCLVGALAGVLAATALAATKSVKVGDNYYVKAKGVPTVSVKKGDKLKFNYAGSSTHNAYSKTINLGAACRKFKSSGSCTTRALTKKGTFTIYCEIHGQDDQSMRVKVG
jgi:plastocyanin